MTKIRLWFCILINISVSVIQLSDRAANCGQSNGNQTKKPRGTDNLVFEGTNPAIFLKMFEKCPDVKSDKDKLYKLRNFVRESDKSEFSTMFFKGDWQGARSTFLQKYSMEFTVNKNKELGLSFEKETSLRSFVAKKNECNEYVHYSV